jgi:hypothetical protein
MFCSSAASESLRSFLRLDLDQSAAAVVPSGAMNLKGKDGMAAAPANSRIRKCLALHFVASLIAFFVGFHSTLGFRIHGRSMELLFGTAQFITGVMALVMPIVITVLARRGRTKLIDFLFYLAICLFMSTCLLLALANAVS